jgi:hypothetical protein
VKQSWDFSQRESVLLTIIVLIPAAAFFSAEIVIGPTWSIPTHIAEVAKAIFVSVTLSVIVCVFPHGWNKLTDVGLGAKEASDDWQD